MTKRQLKGVAIGAGYFSQFHFEAWQRIPHVFLAACCDTDATKAQLICEKFGIQRSYTNYVEMFDVEKPDFVDIITPPTTHQEICAEAARRGIHIICQKALAPTFLTASEIVSHASRNQVRFMVHENFRFQPWHREIKKQIDSGAIGDVHSLAFRSRMGDGWGENAYIPRQPYFRDYPQLLVFENGIHFIDTYRFLAGEISRVHAWIRRLNPLIKGEDRALVVFEFASGSLGEWDANRYNESTSRNPRYTFGEFLIEGTTGSLRLYDDARLTLQKLGDHEQEIIYPHEDKNFAGDCVFFTQQHFVDRLISGEEFETSGSEYLKSLAVQEAVYRSAQTQNTVNIE